MTFSSWFCPNNTNNMFVKIVHPGGRAELHESPILAAQVMLQNPRCSVAYPNVFREPSAVVPPETMLVLGRKYYVVPVSTICKLQGLSPDKSLPPTGMKSTVNGSHHKNEPSGEKAQHHSHVFPNDRRGEKEKKIGCLGEGNCFICLFPRIRINDNNDDDDSFSEARKLNMGSSRAKKEWDEGSSRKRASVEFKGIRVSPKRRTISFDQWQPSLDSIKEE